MKNKILSLFVVAFFVVGLSVFSFSQLVVGAGTPGGGGASGWTPPTQNFPNGNTQPPVDTSQSAQEKLGDLKVGSMTGKTFSASGDLSTNSAYKMPTGFSMQSGSNQFYLSDLSLGSNLSTNGGNQNFLPQGGNVLFMGGNNFWVYGAGFIKLQNSPTTFFEIFPSGEMKFTGNTVNFSAVSKGLILPNKTRAEIGNAVAPGTLTYENGKVYIFTGPVPPGGGVGGGQVESLNNTENKFGLGFIKAFAQGVNLGWVEIGGTVAQQGQQPWSVVTNGIAYNVAGKKVGIGVANPTSILQVVGDTPVNFSAVKGLIIPNKTRAELGNAAAPGTLTYENGQLYIFTGVTGGGATFDNLLQKQLGLTVEEAKAQANQGWIPVGGGTAGGSSLWATCNGGICHNGNVKVVGAGNYLAATASKLTLQNTTTNNKEWYLHSEDNGAFQIYRKGIDGNGQTVYPTTMEFPGDSKPDVSAYFLNGKVGINTENPQGLFDVSGSGSVYFGGGTNDFMYVGIRGNLNVGSQGGSDYKYEKIGQDYNVNMPLIRNQQLNSGENLARWEGMQNSRMSCDSALGSFECANIVSANQIDPETKFDLSVTIHKLGTYTGDCPLPPNGITQCTYYAGWATYQKSTNAGGGIAARNLFLSASGQGYGLETNGGTLTFKNNTNETKFMIGQDGVINFGKETTFGGAILAGQGVPWANAGFSFSGNEGGRDTGMFSPSDGVLQFYVNGQKKAEFTENSTWISGLGGFAPHVSDPYISEQNGAGTHYTELGKHDFCALTRTNTDQYGGGAGWECTVYVKDNEMNWRLAATMNVAGRITKCTATCIDFQSIAPTTYSDRKVFVTSGRWRGDMGGSTPTNQCNIAARAAGLQTSTQNKYRAWVGYGEEGNNNTNSAYYTIYQQYLDYQNAHANPRVKIRLKLTDGTVLNSDIGSSITLSQPINKTEYGSAPTDGWPLVWTNAQTNGKALPNSQYGWCGNWNNSNHDAYGRTGRWDSTSQWSFDNDMGHECYDLSHLYCFQVDE